MTILLMTDKEIIWMVCLLTDLIKRLEEENKVNMYLCQEKLPKV